MAKQITVEELAGLIHVSKSYLNRIFNKQLGMSPIEYLRMVRIETAKRMLVGSSMLIEEISEAIGYNSPKYFYKAFNKCTGMSPRKFRVLEKGRQ